MAALRLPPVVAMSDFRKGKYIQSGVFAGFYEATRCSDGLRVAIGEFRLMSDEDAAEMNEALQRIASQTHPTLLKWIGYIPAGGAGEPAIVTEFMPTVGLQKYIDDERKGLHHPEWTDTRKLIILYGIAVCLSVLHEAKLGHYDLRPANVLLNDACEPVLARLGFDQLIGMTLRGGSRAPRDPSFCAPEVAWGEEYDLAADVYSFGMLMYTVLTAQLPFAGVRPSRKVIQMVAVGSHPEIPPGVSPQYRELIQACWRPGPSDRPTMRTVANALAFGCCPTSPNEAEVFRAYQRKISSGEAENVKVCVVGQPSCKGDQQGGGLTIQQKIICADVCSPNRPPKRLVVCDMIVKEAFTAAMVADLRDARYVIAMFDLTDLASFNAVCVWIDWVRRNCQAPILLVGDKCDSAKPRAVSWSDAEAYGRKNAVLRYLEVSVESGLNCCTIVDEIAEDLEQPRQKPLRVCAADDSCSIA
jgi:serine/threonine protein kinase